MKQNQLKRLQNSMILDSLATIMVARPLSTCYISTGGTCVCLNVFPYDKDLPTKEVAFV